MKTMRERAADGLKVGDVFHTSRTFTREEVDLFAKISGDYNPVHFDAEFAQSRNFSAPICHGLLTASLLTEIGGQIGWLASNMNFQFKRPVYPEQTVTCEWTITAIDERARAQALVVMTNEAGEVVLTAEVGGVVSGEQQRALLKKIIAAGDQHNPLRGR